MDRVICLMMSGKKLQMTRQVFVDLVEFKRPNIYTDPRSPNTTALVAEKKFAKSTVSVTV